MKDVANNKGSTGGITGKGFVKGKSGNPTGRPKTVGEVQDLARQHTEMAILRLAEWAQSDNPKASVSACNALLDRGWGRAQQNLNVALSPDQMTDAQLMAVASLGLPQNGL